MIRRPRNLTGARMLRMNCSGKWCGAFVNADGAGFQDAIAAPSRDSSVGSCHAARWPLGKRMGQPLPIRVIAVRALVLGIPGANATHLADDTGMLRLH